MQSTLKHNIMKIDKSKLMKRAWYLVKKQGYSLSYAMIKVWKELKDFAKEQIEQAKRDLMPEYQGCNIQPTAEAMYNFYNSNEYKGD